MPCCGYLSDAATGLRQDDHTPANGDFSLCLSCGAPLIFTDAAANQLRLATDEDLGLLELSSPTIAAKLSIAQDIIRTRGPL